MTKPPTMPELALLDAASQAISAIETVVEAKGLADRAKALKVFAAQQSWGPGERTKIATIELRATRRMGELLAVSEKSEGGRPKKTGSKSEPVSVAPTLSSLGITKRQSHVAQAVAAVPVKVFNQTIADAEEKGDGKLSTSRMVKLAKREARNGHIFDKTQSGTDATDTLESLIDEGKTFGCVYADPPWQYGNTSTRAAAEDHYPTMTMDALREMPVPKLSAANCHLHLWATSSLLPDALDLMAAWGFTYKSSFVWVKPQIGMGNYWRVSHEFLLLGVKGSLTFRDNSLRSWLEVPRDRHSAKPEKVRDLVMKGSEGPYLELFARQSYPGWTSWGNQL